MKRFAADAHDAGFCGGSTIRFPADAHDACLPQYGCETVPS